MEIKLLKDSILNILHDDVDIVIDFTEYNTPGGIEDSIDRLKKEKKMDVYIANVISQGTLLQNKDSWIDIFYKYQKDGIILSFAQCDIGKGPFIITGELCCDKVFYNIDVGHIHLGVFFAMPDDKYVLDHSPLDMLIGSAQTITKIYRDFEPFYLVSYDNWPSDTQLEVDEVKTLKIQKLTGFSREGVIDLRAYKLKG